MQHLSHTIKPGFSDLRDEVPINAWNKPFLVMFMKYSIVTRIYTEILINQAVDNFTSSRFRESRIKGKKAPQFTQTEIELYKRTFSKVHLST